MHDEAAELSEIRHEIIESRALAIRTNNLTNALAADIKSIAKRQHAYEKRLSWNSATAYVVFVVTILGVLKFAWDARIDAIKLEIAQKTADDDRHRKELRELHKGVEDRIRAEAKAATAYELVRQNKRPELIEAVSELRSEPLSKMESMFFQDAVERAQSDLAAQAYREGQDKARAQHWQEAAGALEESLRTKDDSAVAPNARLALADVYRHLGRHRDAITLLAPLPDGSVDKEIQIDALATIARCDMELGAWNDAKAAWRNLLRRFPESRFSGEARLALGQLTMMH